MKGPAKNSDAVMRVLRFTGARSREPAIDAWLAAQPPEFRQQARRWFDEMRACGPDVRELMHDGAPTACVGDAAFAYVNVFKAHMNVGLFGGAILKDPAGLLEGNGKFMRHVKVKPGAILDEPALSALIVAAYRDMKARR